MPKQIKTTPISKNERTNARLGLAAMLGAFAFGGTFTALLSVLSREGNDGSALAVTVCCLMVIWFVLLLWHCIQGFITYEKQEHYGVLMTSVMTAFSAFTVIVNMQFAAALFLSAIKLDDAAQKVIGERTFDDFMTAQHTPWTLLICGITASVTAGLISMVKLSKHPI